MSDDCKFAELSTGVRLAYVEQGPRDGPPVVMLHGISDSHRSYDLVRPLLPSSWRVFTLAGVGHALHWERPADTAALLRAFIADIEEPAVLTHAFA